MNEYYLSAARRAVAATAVELLERVRDEKFTAWLYPESGTINAAVYSEAEGLAAENLGALDIADRIYTRHI